MTIRPYEASDWDAVRDIYDLAKPDEMRGGVDFQTIVPLSEDPARLAGFRDSTILVAEDAKRVVGFAGHSGNYISWLFVHPAHRRHGVARTLLKEIMGHLRGLITLNVGRWNQGARKLYGDLGFVVVREFIGTFNGHDVEVLTLAYEASTGDPPDPGGPS